MNFLKNVAFINFGSQCGSQHFAVSNLPKQFDHHMEIRTEGISFIGTSDDNKLFLHEPNVGWINPSDCVDMDCDGPKKAMITDTDGSFSETGSRHTYMGFSELDYGINGPRGLGNFRIPAVMITDLSGNAIDIESWAPNKGVKGTHSGACTHDVFNHYYKCDETVEYAQVLYQSMDVDTETRRLAPIAYYSQDTVDIINGVKDTSCCAGYACQLRQTTHVMIMKCGEEYELATTGTLNKDFKLHMNRQDPNCKIKLKIYTRRQNRQDVFIDGTLIAPTNAILELDGTFSYQAPTPAHVPLISDGVGTNFFDRTGQILHVNLQGGSVVRVIVAKTLILEFDSTSTEMTADELYESENLRQYLASLLGIDISKIKVVNVVEENARMNWMSRFGGRSMMNQFKSTRIRRETIGGAKVVVEIDTSTDDVTDEETTVAATNDNTVLEENSDLAEKVVEVIVNDEVPPEVGIASTVAIQTVLPPEPPPACMTELEERGAGCSLATKLEVTPEELLAGEANIKTENLAKIKTHAEKQEEEQEKVQKKEEPQVIARPPVGSALSTKSKRFTEMSEQSIMTPPLRMEMKDDQGQVMKTAGFLDKTYEVQMNIISGDFVFTSDSTTVTVIHL